MVTYSQLHDKRDRSHLQTIGTGAVRHRIYLWLPAGRHPIRVTGVVVSGARVRVSFWGPEGGSIGTMVICERVNDKIYNWSD